MYLFLTHNCNIIIFNFFIKFNSLFKFDGMFTIKNILFNFKMSFIKDDKLDNVLQVIYPINVLISIYCAIVYYKQNDEQFMLVSFAITFILPFLVLMSYFISNQNVYVQKSFIVLYVYISYNIHTYSKLLSLFQIMLSIAVYCTYNYYGVFKRKTLEKKLNHMCYGKKDLDIFNINNDGKKITGYSAEKLKLLMQMIKLNITVPFQILKTKPLDEMENIVYKKMNQYGLDHMLVDTKNMTFIRLWLDLYDTYSVRLPKETIHKMSMNDLFILYHTHRLNLHKDDQKDKEIKIMNDILFETTSDNIEVIRNNLFIELKKYNFTLETIHFIGCYNLINLYLMRKKNIPIPEKTLFALEQATIDAILESKNPKINTMVMNNPDCYHIRYPDEFNIDYYRNMISKATGINIQEFKHLSLDQLQIVLNTYDKQQEVLLPFTDQNLDQMYKTYLQSKPSICSNTVGLSTEIVSSISKLRKLQIPINCENFQGMNYIRFKNYVDNTLLSNKTYTLMDVMNPMLFLKIKEMEKRNLAIDIETLKTLSIPNIATLELMKKHDIPIDQNFDYISSIVEICKIQNIDKLKGMDKKDLVKIINACKANIGFDNAVKGIDNLDVLLLFKTNNLSINDTMLYIDKEKLIKILVLKLKQKSIKLNEIINLVDVEHDLRAKIIKYYNEKNIN